MTNKIQISIPEPCNENWLKMTPIEKGKFCDSCQKKVYDFTSATDREIIQAYNIDQKLCGRFLNTQLDRDILLPKEKSKIWLATTSAIISFIGFGTNEAVAQGNIKVEQTEKKQKPNTIEDDVEVSGVVLDENHIPLSDISIAFKGNKAPIKTDMYGKFSIKVTNCTRLIFYYEGDEVSYTNDSYVVNGNESNVRIICVKEIIKPRIMSTVGGAICVKKRSFFGKLFHSIGNWFR
jgi:hypothetical protein